MSILLHAFVVAGYLAVALAIGQEVVRRSGAPAAVGAGLPSRAGLRSGPRVAIVAVWLVHAVLLREAALEDGAWRFGFALALSATLWLAVALFWFESLVESLVGVWLVLLPLAAWCAVLPLFFPGSVALGRMSGADGPSYSPWLPLHLAVALAAYGVLTIAALDALFMAALDRWLHPAFGDANDPERRGVARVLLGTLPPLLTMERILFRLIGIGFVLLTLTVLSGIVFSEALFGQPIRFDHKTVFTLVAWVTFGALLVGRVTRGWRGRLALSWTLSGFAMLVLAYAGSRFVLEVVLHRV
jgi:ABC-type uncharacterized transport system permease subunit